MREFWWQLILAFLGAFFGFGFSLWLFYRQIQNDKIKDNNSKNKNDRDLLRYFSELLRKNLVVVDRSLTLIDDYIKKQNENHSDLQILQKVPSNDFIRLKNLDNRGVFEAWMALVKEKDGIKKYQENNSAIDILDGVIIHIHEMHTRVTETAYTKFSHVKDSVNSIPDSITYILYELNARKDNNKDDYYHFLDNSISNYSQLVRDGALLDKFISDFVSPLLTDLVQKYPNREYARDLILLCKKCRVNFHDGKVDVERLVNEFKNIRSKIEPSIKILEGTKAKLNQIIGQE